MKRSIRQLVARIAIVGVVFAQMATAAFALPGSPGSLDRPADTGALAGLPASASGGHCAGLATSPAVAPANVCEVHCTDVAALPPAPDLPPVVLSALPVDLIPLSALGAIAECGRPPLAALPGAPPPSLAFCRLLI